MTVGQLKELLNKRNDMDDLEVIVEVDNGDRDLKFNIRGVTSVLLPFGGFVSIDCREEDEDEDEEEVDEIADYVADCLGSIGW